MDSCYSAAGSRHDYQNPVDCSLVAAGHTWSTGLVAGRQRRAPDYCSHNLVLAPSIDQEFHAEASHRWATWALKR